MKLRNKSPEQTLEIVNWLIENVGERVESWVGLHGYGWSVLYNDYTQSYDIRLETDIVDEETQLLFVLTCA